MQTRFCLSVWFGSALCSLIEMSCENLICGRSRTNTMKLLRFAQYMYLFNERTRGKLPLNEKSAQAYRGKENSREITSPQLGHVTIMTHTCIHYTRWKVSLRLYGQRSPSTASLRRTVPVRHRQEKMPN